MKRVADLSGAELDYWVARALYLDFRGCILRKRFDEAEWSGYEQSWGRAYGEWSTDREQGGEIIERERIGIWPGTEEQPHHHVWTACIPSADGTFDDLKECYGATPLEAGMRAFVASKFGEEVGDGKGE